MNATMTYGLDEMIGVAREHKNRAQDDVLKAKEIRWSRGFLDTNRGERLPLTYEAAAQFAGRFGVPTGVFSWLHKNDKPGWLDVTTRAFNSWQEENPDRDLLVRRYTESGGNEVVRAVLSDRYRILDNVQLLEAARDALPDLLGIHAQDIRCSNRGINRDGMSVIIETPKITPEELRVGDTHSAGLQLRNSEIGAGSAQLDAFLRRLTCLNGMTVTVRGPGASRIVHIGGNEGNFLGDQLVERARKILEEAPKQWANYVNLRDIRLENPGGALLDLSRGSITQLGVGMAKTIVQERLPSYVAELGSTAYAVVNAISEHARDMDNPYGRTELEIAAMRMSQAKPARWSAADLAPVWPLPTQEEGENS